jgi:predicted Zn-dependent protease with MMP-like domain
MNAAHLNALAARVVASELGRLPAPVRALAEHVPVHLLARPPAHVLAEGFPDDLLGLFEGAAYGEELALDQPMPPQISLYLDNLWDFAAADEGAFRKEVRVTYLHELGHYLGWDEAELAARGLD